MKQELSLDIIRQDDAVALQQLAQTVGWNFTSGQVELFTSPVGTMFGHRAEGRLVSSAGIYQYGSQLSSLGVVIVHPDFQRQGLGKRVVTQCLIESGRAGGPVTLVATADGFPLYTSLGFQSIGTIHRFERGSFPVVSEASSEATYPVRVDDLPDLIAMDEMVVGANRGKFYRSHFSKIECGLMVRNAENTVQGFGLAVRRHDMLVVGPLIAFDRDLAVRLLRNFASAWAGPVRLDVPGEQIPFMAKLNGFGFKEIMVSPQMVLHAASLPGQRNLLFGIVDPVFG